MTQIIEITVSPKGETTVQTRGFQGGSCRDASRFIEQALGHTVISQLFDAEAVCIFQRFPRHPD